MPRTPRVEYENAVYHGMARGDRREPIVLDDEDRTLFLDTFGEACGRTGWEVFAWVLLDNHYHAVFRSPEPNLVFGMQWFQNVLGIGGIPGASRKADRADGQSEEPQ